MPREAVAGDHLEEPVADESSAPLLPVGTQEHQDAAVSPRPAGRRRRGSRRMLRPDGHSHYRALAVADVDLDRRVATLVPPVTAYERPPEGVHALVWFHGQPIGELTLPGEPATLLPTLPRVAARELAQAIEEHRLRDALATSGGLAQVRERGLGSISHPDESLDGTEVTVAICTRDRPDNLRRCLAAVELLDPAPAAVLVVDNASVDHRTRQVAEEYGVGYVREPRAGLDWARNRALLEATTRIVAFTDDDVLVHPGWIAGVARAFREEPDAVAVTGLVAPAELATSAQVLFEAYGGFGRGYSRQWMSVAVEGGEVAAQIYPGTGGAGTGANMALLRDEVLALGGFDPALDVGTPTGGGGDLEMYFRVLAAGHLLVYEPTAVVRHVHRRTEAELLRQMRGHGTGSYSIFTGAGLRYGAVQAREFIAFSLWWAFRRHGVAHLNQVLRRRTLPWALDCTETMGMLATVGGRYYSRARKRAAHLSTAHHREPQAPAVVRPHARRSRTSCADPVVTVELTEPLHRESHPSAAVADGRARRVRIRVERDGVPEAHVVVRMGGSPPSRARLFWELVSHLGPALVVSGSSWRDFRAMEQSAFGVSAGVTPAQDGSGESAVPEARIVVLPAARGREPSDQQSASLSTEAARHGAQVTWVGSRHELRRFLEPTEGSTSSVDGVTVFLRADLVVTPEWLTGLLTPFTSPDVLVVTGNVLPEGHLGAGAQWGEYLTSLGRGPHREVYDHQWLRGSRRPAPLWQIGTLANAAVRGSALSHLAHVADPAALSEDLPSEDLFYRVLSDGGRVVYQASAVALSTGSDLDPDTVRREVMTAGSHHVASLLNVVVEHRDPRGLLRLGIVLPRQRVRRLWHWLRGRDDVPGDLLLADLTGLVRGLAWWRWRRR